MKSLSWREVNTPVFIAIFITTEKTWKLPKGLSVGKLINNIYIYMYIYKIKYLVIKEGNQAIWDRWMHLDSITLSEISETKTNTIWSYVWNLKKNSEFKETEHTTVIARENEMLLKGYELPVLRLISS